MRRGHEDADTHELRVYSPTPQMKSLMLFITMALQLDLDIHIADLENAFCQGRSPEEAPRPCFLCALRGLESSFLDP